MIDSSFGTALFLHELHMKLWNSLGRDSSSEKKHRICQHKGPGSDTVISNCLKPWRAAARQSQQLQPRGANVGLGGWQSLMFIARNGAPSSEEPRDANLHSTLGEPHSHAP